MTFARRSLVLAALVLGTLGFASTAGAAPATSIHGGPTGTTTARSATFHVMATGAVRIQCRLNTGAWYVCVRSSSGYVTLRRLGVRTHTFRARGVARNGAVDRTPAVRTWRVRR